MTSLPEKRIEKRTIFVLLFEKRKPNNRTMFLKTLGIGSSTILNLKNKQVLVSKMNNLDLYSLKTKDSCSKLFELERQEFRNFFESLPVIELRCCRASTPKKYLLPEWRSKRFL